MRFLHLAADGTPIDDGQLHHVYGATRTQATDGTDTLTIITTDPISKDDRILYKTEDGSWAEHIVTKTDTVRADGQAYGTYTCENSLQEIAGKAITEYKQTTGPTGAMQTALADTGWTLGTIQSNGINTATLELENTDAYSMVEEIANAFDLEVETSIRVEGNGVASRTVNLVAQRGSNVGRTFRYAKDLTEIRRTVGTDHPITRLWVYGKTESGSDGSEGSRASIDSVNGGRKYLDAPADILAAWGRPGPDGTRLPYEGTVTFSEVEDPAELLRLGKAQLTKQSKVTVNYEGSVVALGHGGLDADNAMIGDTVRIIDDVFPGGLRLEGRVLKLERDLLDGPASTTITLGTIVEPITRQNAKVQNTVQKLWDGKGAWDDAANLTGGYLDGVIAGINKQMNETGGYTYLIPGEGLYVYDKPKRADGSDRDATMAIQIGGGYFRIANSRKSDGTWAWRTMGTGAGLVADVIIAGMLRGGSSWWNLDTGEVQFSDGIIRSADDSTYWNLGTGEFRTDGTIDGGTIRGTDIEAATITGGTINASKLNAPTVNGGTIDQSDITSQSGSQKATMANGVLEFYRNGGKVGEISAASGGMNIEYGSGYGITMSDGGTSIEDNSGSSIRLGTGGFSVEDTSGNSIQLGPGGLSISTDYGQLRMGSGGLNFTNDQGWGLSLSASGWSIEWAGGHRLATGPEAGALYIDGNRINTGGTASSDTQSTTPSDKPTTQTTRDDKER